MRGPSSPPMGARWKRADAGARGSPFPQGLFIAGPFSWPHAAGRSCPAWGGGMAFFILALVIAVVVLWSRVGSLLQRLEELEKTLAKMRQDARIEPQSSRPVVQETVDA